jgi:putative membrane protein
MNPLTPLRGGPGPHGWEDGSLSALPFLGSILLVMMLLAVLTAIYLWRQDKLPLHALGRRPPEDEARRILAERFANGDVSSDEFMERAAILNWTPGSDTMTVKTRKKRR